MPSRIEKTKISETLEVSRGFAPIVGRAPRVLLLGSLPGRASLEAGEYYAMPQNSFWRIMDRLCGAGPGLAYADRVARLKQAGIALWDVLHAACRPGSLDANIVAATEQVNDIAGLILAHPTIEIIGFNGNKAGAVFRRYVGTALPRDDLEFADLPSTSPAYAGMRPDDKAASWCRALAPHLTSD